MFHRKGVIGCYLVSDVICVSLEGVIGFYLVSDVNCVSFERCNWVLP